MAVKGPLAPFRRDRRAVAEGWTLAASGRRGSARKRSFSHLRLKPASPERTKVKRIAVVDLALRLRTWISTIISIAAGLRTCFKICRMKFA
jgi:hypothetical protein